MTRTMNRGSRVKEGNVRWCLRGLLSARASDGAWLLYTHKLVELPLWRVARLGELRNV